MSITINKLREMANEIDSGIRKLEKRLDPLQLVLVNDATGMKADQVVSSIEDNVISMMGEVDEVIEVRSVKLEENYKVIETTEVSINKVINDLDEMQNHLVRLGVLSSSNSSGDSHSGVTRKSSSFLNGSLSFASPNYNSTPSSFMSNKYHGQSTDDENSRFKF